MMQTPPKVLSDLALVMTHQKPDEEGNFLGKLCYLVHDQELFQSYCDDMQEMAGCNPLEAEGVEIFHEADRNDFLEVALRLMDKAEANGMEVTFIRSRTKHYDTRDSWQAFCRRLSVQDFLNQPD